MVLLIVATKSNRELRNIVKHFNRTLRKIDSKYFCYK